MSNEKKVAASARSHWQKPELKRLGALRDIAGNTGLGDQSGPNSRAPNWLS